VGGCPPIQHSPMYDTSAPFSIRHYKWWGQAGHQFFCRATRPLWLSSWFWAATPKESIFGEVLEVERGAIQPNYCCTAVSVIAFSADFLVLSIVFFRDARYSTLLDSTRLYSTLLDATRRYSTLLDATLRNSTLLYALRYSMLLYATLRYSTLRYSTLLYATLRYTTLLYAIDPTRRYFGHDIACDFFSC
jgi:hypothetical protein